MASKLHTCMQSSACSLQGVIAYLEFLTLRAIYEVYIGNRTFQADRVKQNFNNIKPVANASDLTTRLSEVPQQGIEALVCPLTAQLAACCL